MRQVVPNLLLKQSNAMVFSKEFGSVFAVSAGAARWVAVVTTQYPTREAANQRYYSHIERCKNRVSDIVIRV